MKRSQETVVAEMQAIGRPSLFAGGINRIGVDLEAWKVANPEAENRYQTLASELEAYEARVDAERAAKDRSAAYNAKFERLPAEVREALPRIELDPTVRQRLRDWVTGERSWLVLAGPPGTGKSLTAGWVLVQLAKRGQAIRWVRAAKLVTLVGGWSGEAEAQRLEHVDALAVDDVGTEHRTDFSTSVFDALLCGRHENLLKTVLTTNLKREELRTRLGPRVADRVFSECEFIEFISKSRRGAA